MPIFDYKQLKKKLSKKPFRFKEQTEKEEGITYLIQGSIKIYKNTLMVYSTKNIFKPYRFDDDFIKLQGLLLK